MKKHYGYVGGIITTILLLCTVNAGCYRKYNKSTDWAALGISYCDQVEENANPRMEKYELEGSSVPQQDLEDLPGPEADAQNLISNGSFEDFEIQYDWDIVPASELNGWLVSWVEADACDNADGIVTSEPVLEILREDVIIAPDGAQFAELDTDCQGSQTPGGGVEKTNVTLSRTISTSVYNSYEINFQMRGREPIISGKLEVRFANEIILSEPPPLNEWKQIQIRVIAYEENSLLEFTDRGHLDNIGVLLDDVRVYDLGPVKFGPEIKTRPRYWDCYNNVMSNAPVD